MTPSRRLQDDFKSLSDDVRLASPSDSYAGLYSFIMRPSSLGGGRILRRTLSVRLSVRPVIVAMGDVFSAPLASRIYFSARTEGRISYGHLGRTDSCFI